MLLRQLEPERYWAMSAAASREKREIEIRDMIFKGNYSYQLKTDGNYSAFICDFDNEKCLISRGISTVTHEYGRLEDKVFFFDSVAAAFHGPTRIMGEIWLENGIDRDVGSILRSGEVKAKSIQSDIYYSDAINHNIKFSAKDKRDIENNPFRGQYLKWRIFDVWYFDGKDLMSTPWIERQEYVRKAAERINHPLVTYVPYYPMDDNFYENLAQIFESGGEGVVCYNNMGLPEPGKRTAHKTLKVKQELENLIDCFIIGIEEPTKIYNGKDLGNWQYWYNNRTGDRIIGDYFEQYQLGGTYEPITKNYYYNWPGAIIVGVYDQKHEVIQLCKVAGLSEDFKTELRDNFSDWYLCPVTIGGMMLSQTTSNELSVRHPYLKSIRKGDIDPEDCTLKKILN